MLKSHQHLLHIGPFLIRTDWVYHVRTFRFRSKSKDIHDKLIHFQILYVLSVIMIEYSNGRVFCTFSFLRICSRQKLMAWFLELVSKELNHLAAILHVYAGVWILWSKKNCYYFSKRKRNTFTLLVIFIVKSLQKRAK